jgi:hypothetical protein
MTKPAWIDPYTIKIGTFVGHIDDVDRLCAIQNKLRRRGLVIQGGVVLKSELVPVPRSERLTR